PRARTRSPVHAPSELAGTGPGSDEVVAFEAIVDPLIERSWGIPQRVGSAPQSRRCLVATLCGGDGGKAGESFVGGVAKCVLGAQSQPTLKRVASMVCVT
ncbi:MAG: hypothetical protein M3076_05665, partial [Actinomycetota bacterium]|nr:hypothetical protein [Actinomycetota bacterium]